MAKLQADIFSKPVKMKWKEVAPLPVGRSAHTAVLLHGSVYVGGGFEGKSDAKKKDCYRLDIYNVYTNHWDSSPITTPHCLFAMTVLNDKLIIVGGKTKSDDVTNKIFVLDEGEWKDYNEMPTARYHATAVGYQSMVIVVGGQAKIKGTKWIKLSTTELLDTTNGCWYTCDNLPVPLIQLKAVVTGNTLHLMGGLNNDSPSLQVFTASLDNLSSHQLKWQSFPDTPWCYLTPVVLYNKFLLTVGGRQPSDMTSKTSKVCAFNPSTGLWRKIANIPSARSFAGVVSLADDWLIMMGGATIDGKFSCETYIGQCI